PEAEPRRLRHRETDRFVHDAILAERGTSVWPLSVAADRIAVCAWRCAALLSERDVDRTGAGGVVEVYPAGALAMWGLPHRGYKRNSRTSAETALAKRRTILASIRAAAGARLEVPDEVLADDDAFDAFVSALVARAAAVEQTIAPPADLRSAAAREGWIHLPLPDSLTTVLKRPKPAGPSS
ncbi:MAG: DUF429 domain-containing protein, partial [Actinomycetota bacterium]|nr:DUF429 domain-containing protein [Actinomycetota bacterium]